MNANIIRQSDLYMPSAVVKDNESPIRQCKYVKVSLRSEQDINKNDILSISIQTIHNEMSKC